MKTYLNQQQLDFSCRKWNATVVKRSFYKLSDSSFWRMTWWRGTYSKRIVSFLPVGSHGTDPRSLLDPVIGLDDHPLSGLQAAEHLACQR